MVEGKGRRQGGGREGEKTEKALKKGRQKKERSVRGMMEGQGREGAGEKSKKEEGKVDSICSRCSPSD